MEIFFNFHFKTNFFLDRMRIEIQGEIEINSEFQRSQKFNKIHGKRRRLIYTPSQPSQHRIS